MLTLLLLASLVHVELHASAGTPTCPVEFGAFTRGQHADAVLAFDWDFGDGVTETTAGPVVSHQYTHVGAYQVTVLVRDTTRADQFAVSEPIHAIVREDVSTRRR